MYILHLTLKKMKKLQYLHNGGSPILTKFDMVMRLDPPDPNSQ